MVTAHIALTSSLADLVDGLLDRSSEPSSDLLLRQSFVFGASRRLDNEVRASNVSGSKYHPDCETVAKY